MKNRIKIISLIIFMVVAGVFCRPFVVTVQGSEEEETKTVRIGWHEAPYCIIDEYGRRSGYTYEFQQKVAAYTGWSYEYVEGSWSELFQMLKDGEIDLMGNISYSEERAKEIQYSYLPMGTEAYYVFVSPENTEIVSEDYTSLNGKRIGVAKGSIQSELFLNWEKEHGVTAELVEFSGPEEESLLKLDSELDAFVTLDIYTNPATLVPVWKIGSLDFFFAVSKDRSDLLPELNSALGKIQDENKYYSQQLNAKYLKSMDTSRYLTNEEREWLEEHGTIRVGYLDNYLAFCAKDPVTGELTGVLKDYLDYVADGMENASLDFEAVCYPTAAAAITALQNGEIDCMFPANLSAYDGEALGVVMTPVLMKTEMDAVIRQSDQRYFAPGEQVVVAVNEGNTNYEMFLVDNFPDWQIKYFEDTPAGLDGVAAGEADCVVISNYRFSNIAKQCEKLHLTTVYTGVDLEYYFAVRRGDTQLYSILTKTTDIIPDSTIHATLTYYSTEDAKTSFIDHVRENLVAILIGIIVIVLLILVLLIRSIRAERKAIEEERLIHALNKQVFEDALTHVRNKGGFDNYIAKLQEQLEQGKLTEIAFGMFDCDNLKQINDEYGHDKGNIYLQTACRLICNIFVHSPVFRIGGDEFIMILMGEDYQNREELIRRFEEAQKEICSSTKNRWEQVHVALGIAEYDPETDRSLNDTVRRSDQLMYENKRNRKT
ncbi:MAG: transporter substrate-binding domain-containing protein [Lachnospiraceae bacterium]|nr:transporter substrate-binding domain-containing protein [Lachnospiraceae bacterium]